MKTIDQELEEAYWAANSAAYSATHSAYWAARSANSAASSAARTAANSVEWISEDHQEEINHQINLILELL